MNNDSPEHTPLCIAIQRGESDIIQQIICHEDDFLVWRPCICERIPLETALDYDGERSVKKKIIDNLLDRGASVFDRLFSGLKLIDSIMSDACFGDDQDRLNTLLGFGMSPNIITEHSGKTLLMQASMHRSEVVQELLAHGADVNSKDTEGWTALMCACSLDASFHSCDQESISIVEMLMRANADRFVKNDKGHSAIDVLYRQRHASQFVLDNIEIILKTK